MVTNEKYQISGSAEVTLGRLRDLRLSILSGSMVTLRNMRRMELRELNGKVVK